MIAAGSMSASAVKEGAGARTQAANLVAWTVTIITLLFFTPLFTTLPEAGAGSLDYPRRLAYHRLAKLQEIRRESRTEFWFGVLAMAGVLLIDVLEGMVIGLLASLVFVIYRSSRPHLALVGRVPGIPGAYTDMGRHPQNTPVPGVIILRLDGPLYYANVLTTRDKIKVVIDESEPPPWALILDSTAEDQIDLTSMKMLIGLVKELQGKGIVVAMADVHAPVLEYGREMGLLALIGEHHIFPTIELAVRTMENDNPRARPATGKGCVTPTEVSTI